MKFLRDITIAGGVSFLIASFSVSSEWGSNREALDNITDKLDSMETNQTQQYDKLDDRLRQVEVNVGALTAIIDERRK